MPALIPSEQNLKEIIDKSFDLDSLNKNITEAQIEFVESEDNDEVASAPIDLSSQILDAESIISRATFSFDMPEIVDFNASFFYNYFVKDEKSPQGSNIASQKIINLRSYNTEDIHFLSSTEQDPRYVKLEFSSMTDPFANTGNLSDFGFSIEEVFKKVIVEGASSNLFYSGFELLDTNKEINIYRDYDKIISFFNFPNQNYSLVEKAKQVGDLIQSNGGLFGSDKKILVEAMANLQSSKVKFTQTNVSVEDQARANNPVSRQSFSIKMNNFLMKDVLDYSNRIRDSIFQDEIAALQPIANEIQSDLVSKINANNIYWEDFDIFVEAIEEEPIDEIDVADFPNEITIVGFLLEKFKVQPGGGSIKVGTRLLSANQNIHVDPDVEYGSVYTYKIRTLCVVKSIVRSIYLNENDERLVYATFVMASEGETVSVACIETKPPPPPHGFRIDLDYKNRIPFLHWEFPFEPQRDIKRFQVFKRENINQPFTLIAEYDFDDSEVATQPGEKAQESNYYKMTLPKLCYLDTKYRRGSSPIYALASVDAHGFTSQYSAQLQVRYDPFRNVLKTKFISRHGAPKPFPNLYINEDSFQDCIKSSGMNRMTVFFDPEYSRLTQRRAFFNEGGALLVDHQDLDLLAINPNQNTYYIHIVNADLQDDEVVGIKIADKSGIDVEMPVANISKNNLSFEFGIQN